MKKTLLIALIAGAFSVGRLFADTVTITYPDPKFDGNPNLGGGEFVATVTGASTYSFITFCLEHSESISLNEAYHFTVGTYAVLGGVNNNGSDPAISAVPPGDTLSNGTAWLYEQFRAGTLAGYPGADHDTNAGLLQKAIWWLEDEIALTASDVLANPFLQAAIAEYNGQVKANYDPNTSSVRVMNPYVWTTVNNERVLRYRQSLLTLPDGGMTLAFLGAALVGLVAFRRRCA